MEARLAQGWAVTEPARSAYEVGAGQLLLMPGWDAGSLAVKVLTVRPAGLGPNGPRVQGVFVIFDLSSLAPVMVVDAAGVTALRTPAISAVATRHLAHPDASRLVVFGTGPQAVGHVHAMGIVRRVTSVGIVGRTPGSAGRLASELRDAGVDAAAVGPEAVRDADLVCTCTTSRTPVFDGTLLPEQVHINAIGSHEPTARELDDATFAGATVVVDSLDMALREAGDVVMALNSGALAGATSLVPLPSVVRSGISGTSPTRTVFKSVGTAGQDLVTGELLSKVLVNYL